MTAEKSQKLKAFLEKLPDHLVDQLTQTVERDKLTGGSDMPHELLLQGLRTALAEGEHAVNRTPTPMRMFCMPVEDLLVGQRVKKRAGRIARSSLTPVWEWLASDLMAADFRELYDNLTVAIIENDAAKVRETSTVFHQAGADAISKAFAKAPEGSKARAEFANTLGGEDVTMDAEEIGLMLGAAPEILELREVFRAPVPTLTRELLTTLCEKYDSVAKRSPESARYLLAVAMHRLSRPWEILRVTAFLTKTKDTGAVSRDDLDMVVDLLFTDMEDSIAHFEEQKVRTFDPDEARHHITTYARLAKGIAAELESFNDEAWKERYDVLQADGAEEFERLIEQVPEQVKAAMPFRLVGAQSSISSRRPDLRNDPDRVVLDRAVRLANFMRESRPLAFAANVETVHSAAYDVILDNLNAYRNGLLTELRSFEDASLLSRARAYLDLTVELTAILVSEGEAQIFRRKGAQAERPDIAATG